MVGVLYKLYCALQEWKSGTFQKLNFDEPTYSPIYRCLLKQLKTTAESETEDSEKQKETLKQILEYCL